MKPPAAIRARLIRVGETPDERIDLAGTALILAAIERPGAAPEPYSRHLEKLRREVRAYAGGQSDEIDMRAEALVQVLARRYGYRGEEGIHEDPDGANLMGVIDRRSGVPVALGILYIHVARSLGWAMDGLGFPARFLVRLELKGRRMILDPFAEGRTMDARDMRALHKATAGNQAELAPGLFQVLGNRMILVRLQSHWKTRYLRAERLEDALDAVETMLLFAPGRAALWREAGLINARLDKVKEAVAALEEYMRRDAGDGARYRTSMLLQELRGRLN